MDDDADNAEGGACPDRFMAAGRWKRALADWSPTFRGLFPDY
jgi:hypothetical protein